MGGAPRNPLVDPAARLVVAHRGASGVAPENTLVAFRLAVDQRADALELDVRATADDVPVVIHDPTLERTAGIAGAVAALPLARVRAADAGMRFSPDGGRTHPWRGRGVVVPTLEEVLAAFPALPLLVEIKDPAAQHAVRRVLERHGAAARCVVASMEHTALAAFAEAPFVRGASRREAARLWVEALVGARPRAARYRALAVPERYRGLPVLTRRFVAAARALGCAVHAWTVNDPARARVLWARGIAGVITDVPATIAAARGAG
jgi:glycerophosphoryl diester phosphodiesterase